MNKGVLYTFGICGVVAFSFFIAMQLGEQTRAERAELATKIEIESQNFDEVFYESWGNEDKAERARSLREELEAELVEKQLRLAQAEEASKESLAELKKSLEDQSQAQEAQ